VLSSAGRKWTFMAGPDRTPYIPSVSERVRLLERAKAGSLPISDLAVGLKRDIRAVSRDVGVLERAGLLRTSFRTNPGHGRLKIVEALARGYRLTANL
jgi:DNA-binding transcriptional ArsR family regulator